MHPNECPNCGTLFDALGQCRYCTPEPGTIPQGVCRYCLGPEHPSGTICAKHPMLRQPSPAKEREP